MPAERYYYEGPLKENILLTGNEHRHLSKVMRNKEGNQVEVVNGRGTLAQAQVQAICKNETELTILKTSHQSKEDQITLVQAIPRINRLDIIVEKGTELGMTKLQLFPAERSERKSLTAHQIERLKGLTIAAMKQCGRLWLPEIEILEPISKWKTKGGLFGSLSPEAPKLKDIKAPSLIVIGPESGLTEKEISQLEQLDYAGITLHKHILRTDTAAIAALAIITS